MPLFFSLSSKQRVAIARGVMTAAGIFCATVLLLLFFSWTQARRVAQMPNPALAELASAIQRNPQNSSLIRQARELDLLMRQAFFSAAVFRRRGAWLLLAGALVFLLAAHFSKTGLPLPDFSCSPPQESPMARGRARLAVTFMFAVLVLVAVDLIRRQTRFSVVKPPDAAKKILPDPRIPAETRPEVKASVPVVMADQVWPGFRGLNGNGNTDIRQLPTVWNGKTGVGIRWRTHVPLSGFSSPVVWGENIFLTGADARTRKIFCYALKDGALRWSYSADGIPGSPNTPPEVTRDTGYAAPTPATDGKRVFALFATGDIVCVDFAGRRQWARNLGVPENHYGHASSLLYANGRLLIQYDHGGGARLLALDPETGKTRWQTRREVDTSWASPLMVPGTPPLVILNASPLVTAYNALNGRQVWQTDCMSGEVAPSPASDGTRVFVVNEYAILAALDLQNGKVIWQTDEDLAEVSSPLVRQGLLFVATSTGILSCYAADSGTRHWQKKFKTGFYASPLGAGERIYLTERSGVTHVLACSATFREIASSPLNEPVVCTPAIVQNALIIRGTKNLYRISPPDK